MSELIIIGLVAASTFAILVYMPDAYMASKIRFWISNRKKFNTCIIYNKYNKLYSLFI